jgi:hypothetical protein
MIVAVLRDCRDQMNYSILDRIPNLLPTLERAKAIELLEEMSFYRVLDHRTVSLLAHAILDVSSRWK